MSSSIHSSSWHGSGQSAALAPGELRTAAAYARGLVQAMVKRQPPRGLLPPAIAARRVMGARLTLHRAGQVRRQAIRYARGGELELDHSIGYLMGYLASSVSSAQGQDAAVTIEELPQLGLTLTVMLDSRRVLSQAEAAMREIDPTRHGVLLEHPAGVAMVFPEPGEDDPLDASRLLARCATQAGLPADAWRRDARAGLTTFTTQDCELEPESAELSWLSLTGQRMAQLAAIATRAMRQQAERIAPIQATGDWLLDQVHPLPVALRATTDSGRQGVGAGKAHTLASLAHKAGLSLREEEGGLPMGESLSELTVYAQPIRLCAVKDVYRPAQAYYLTGAGLPASLVTDAGSAEEALSRAGAAWNAWHAGHLAVWAMTGRPMAVRQRRGPGVG